MAGSTIATAVIAASSTGRHVRRFTIGSFQCTSIRKSILVAGRTGVMNPIKWGRAQRYTRCITCGGGMAGCVCTLGIRIHQQGMVAAMACGADMTGFTGTTGRWRCIMMNSAGRFVACRMTCITGCIDTQA